MTQSENELIYEMASAIAKTCASDACNKLDVKDCPDDGVGRCFCMMQARASLAKVKAAGWAPPRGTVECSTKCPVVLLQQSYIKNKRLSNEQLKHIETSYQDLEGENFLANWAEVQAEHREKRLRKLLKELSDGAFSLWLTTQSSGKAAGDREVRIPLWALGTMGSSLKAMDELIRDRIETKVVPVD